MQQQQQQQPKELLDFFTSLENEKVNIFYNPVIQQPMFTPVMAQPTGHNPFRTNDNNSNNMMMTTTIPQQSTNMLPQPSMPGMLPQQSTSSMLPQQQTGTANPFRSNTMPQMSTSTPTLPFYNNNNNLNNGQFQSMGNATMMQQAPTMNTNNPFAMSPVTTSPQASTIMVAPPVTGASHNPFNNTTPKHQQLQPWGSSLF